MLNPAAPWQMWGSAVRLPIETTGLSIGRATEQIARVNYRRPDTWRFLLAARLLEAVNANPVVATLTIDYVVVPGVGRALVEIDDRNALTPANHPAFCRFVYSFVGGPGAVLPIGQLKWTTATRSPLLDDTDPASSIELHHFVAQDIQCTARLMLDSRPSPSSAVVELHAFFAPAVHIRPDWASEDYRGGETGGT